VPPASVFAAFVSFVIALVDAFVIAFVVAFVVVGVVTRTARALLVVMVMVMAMVELKLELEHIKRDRIGDDENTAFSSPPPPLPPLELEELPLGQDAALSATATDRGGDADDANNDGATNDDSDGDGDDDALGSCPHARAARPSKTPSRRSQLFDPPLCCNADVAGSNAGCVVGRCDGCGDGVKSAAAPLPPLSWLLCF
jgi:hypothetical protein